VIAKGLGYRSSSRPACRPTLAAGSAWTAQYQGLTTGIIGLCNKGQPRKPDDWGRAAGVGLGREPGARLLGDRQGRGRETGRIEGLSRYGKAALVTLAYDERFAIGFIGSKRGRRGKAPPPQLTARRSRTWPGRREYHWMAGNYLKYAGPLTAKDLLVDAHELIALCAPRPVFVSVGSLQVEGGWVDAKGMFLAAVGAGPVYELLGSGASARPNSRRRRRRSSAGRSRSASTPAGTRPARTGRRS